MNLRELKIKDAFGMIEWMHDDSVTHYLQKDFSSKNILDCIFFILSKQNNDIHYAITNEKDEYMGTVSLKNVFNNSAEFAITLRKDAMGKGYSAFAIREIIDIAFTKFDINCVYWYVRKDNIRAIKFYNKCGYFIIDKNILLPYNVKINNVDDNYIWYVAFN